MVTPGNSSLTGYELSSPRGQGDISFPIVPAKVLGLDLIGLDEVTRPSLKQSKWPEVCGVLARHAHPTALVGVNSVGNTWTKRKLGD